jgi:hypothetical protein
MKLTRKISQSTMKHDFKMFMTIAFLKPETILEDAKTIII